MVETAKRKKEGKKRKHNHIEVITSNNKHQKHLKSIQKQKSLLKIPQNAAGKKNSPPEATPSTSIDCR